MILVGIAETFKDPEPVEFTNLIDVTEAHGVSVYRLSSHYGELTDTINNRAERMVRETLVPKFDATEAKIRHAGQATSIIGDFHLSGSIDLSHTVNYHSLKCDRRSKTVSIRPPRARSTRPQDYPEKLGTTSELLEYVSALLDSSFVLDMGDSFSVSGYAWQKFIVRFMDYRSIDLGRIMINDTDPEEWDFVYAEFDDEIASVRNRV